MRSPKMSTWHVDSAGQATDGQADGQQSLEAAHTGGREGSSPQAEPPTDRPGEEGGEKRPDLERRGKELAGWVSGPCPTCRT